MSDGDLVVLNPVFLTSLRMIAQTFGVGVETVRAWADEGAPIAVENEGGRRRYSAEGWSLQRWRVARRGA